MQEIHETRTRLSAIPESKDTQQTRMDYKHLSLK